MAATGNADGKIRYAVISGGWFSQAAVLPAFANATKNSELVAILSSDPVKRQELSRTYGVQAYRYEEYDQLLSSGSVDAVYIVSPNTEHHDYTVTAARHGVHVLCEKPLAATSDEARSMIQECETAGVKFMTAYRLHFEEANLTAIDVIHKQGLIGEPRVFSSVFTQQIEEGNTRLNADLGGSPLIDIGIYCINASRYLFQDDPIEVMAMLGSNGETRFSEVPEHYSVSMRFPKERLATFVCSFGGSNVSEYRVVGTNGDLRLEPAFTFQNPIVHFLTIDGKTTTTKFAHRDHVGAEIAYFSDCILKNQQPGPDGYEGLADLVIIEAIEQSARTGKSVLLDSFKAKKRPSLNQQISKPSISTPELVNAAPPEGEA